MKEEPSTCAPFNVSTTLCGNHTVPATTPSTSQAIELPCSPLSPVEAHDKQQRGTLRQVSFNLDTFISCWVLS